MKNKIEKQKIALNAISIFAIILALAAIAGGILLVVFGCKKFGGDDKNIAAAIVMLVFGILCFPLGIFIGIYGVFFLATGASLKATHGSVAEGNLGVGTVNMLKCKNCGAEISETDQCCPNCGHSVVDKKVCKACGATNMAESKCCTVCGKPLD